MHEVRVPDEIVMAPFDAQPGGAAAQGQQLGDIIDGGVPVRLEHAGVAGWGGLCGCQASTAMHAGGWAPCCPTRERRGRGPAW